MGCFFLLETMEQKFILYHKIYGILLNNNFFPFTAKRYDGNKITYIFKTIKWGRNTITVDALNITPKEIPSKKIVLGVKINNFQLNNFKEFNENLNKITTYKQKMKK